MQVNVHPCPYPLSLEGKWKRSMLHPVPLSVAHQWADWLHHPYRLGCPQRLRAGDKISSGAQMGTV